MEEEAGKNRFSNDNENGKGWSSLQNVDFIGG